MAINFKDARQKLADALRIKQSISTVELSNEKASYNRNCSGNVSYIDPFVVCRSQSF